MKNRPKSWPVGFLALVLLLFHGVNTPVLGDDLKLDNILQHLRSTFAEIEDYTVMLDVTSNIRQVRVPQMKVKAFFKQPDKLHLESRGFAMLPRESMLLNPNRFNREDFYMTLLGKETLKDMETFKLELVPRKDSIKVRKLILWVDPLRWIILKIDSITWQGQSFEVTFKYDKFLEKHWLPVKASVMVDLSGFKGFSHFHDRPEWEEKKEASGDKKGEVIVRFYEYRVNTGISDSIFTQADPAQIMDGR